MIPRDSEQTIRRLQRGFPVITLTGPRQSGKTPLARAIFADRPYASLEDPDVHRDARDDPRSFLERFPDGGVLDEVQRRPELLSYLQTLVDADGRMGLYILTGSQQFGLTSGKTVNRDFFAGLEKWQALAGDTATNPTLIHGGSETYRHKGVRVIGWKDSGALFSLGGS